MKTVMLLTLSDIFMIFARYGRLKFRNHPLFKVIIIARFIAFFEYCFQVPANRTGYDTFSAAQIKTTQKVILLAIFGIFFIFYLKESFKWNYPIGILAVFFVFHK